MFFFSKSASDLSEVNSVSFTIRTYKLQCTPRLHKIKLCCSLGFEIRDFGIFWVRNVSQVFLSGCLDAIFYAFKTMTWQHALYKLLGYQ